MKVYAVPYAYDGGLQGVEVFVDYEKAKKFTEELEKEHTKGERLDLFIQRVEVK